MNVVEIINKWLNKISIIKNKPLTPEQFANTVYNCRSDIEEQLISQGYSQDSFSKILDLSIQEKIHDYIVWYNINIKNKKLPKFKQYNFKMYSKIILITYCLSLVFIILNIPWLIVKNVGGITSKSFQQILAGYSPLWQPPQQAVGIDFKIVLLELFIFTAIAGISYFLLRKSSKEI